MIGLDDRFFPLIVQDWGKSHTEDDIRDFCRRQEVIVQRTIAEGARTINVSVGGVNMTAADRRLIADWITTLPAGWDSQSLGVFVVVDGALARGALIALKWMSPSLRNVTFVSDLNEALSHARAAFEEAGVAVPRGMMEFSFSLLRQ